MEVINDKTEIQLAQVSDGRLQLGGLFNSFKVDINKYKDIIESFKELDFSKAIFKDENGKANWDAIAKAIEGCDETALSYFKTLDDGNGTINNQSASVEGLSTHLQSTGQAFDFAAIKATLFNAALNAGIMLLASFVVDGVIKAWDKMNLTVEEQTERVNELKSSYEGLKSEYDTLSQKQDITDVEKRRLEYLERRLELDERILKAEEHQLFEEKTGTKFTDWFDKDNYNVQYAKETSIDRINTNPDNFAFLSRLYDKKMADIKATQEQIEEWTKYRDSVEEGSDEWNVYQSHIDDAQNRQTNAMKDLDNSANQMTVNLGKYADNIEYFEEQLASGDLNEEDTAIAEKHLKNWQELYNATEKMLDEIQKLNGTYDDTQDRMNQSIRSISDNHGISDRNQYTELIEYTKDFTDEEKKLWLESTQGAENATQAIEMYEAALVKAQQTANETGNLSFNTENFSSVVDALSSVQSLYSDFKEKADEGIDFTVDFSDIEGLRETFTKLGVPTEQFDEFENVLSSSSSTAEQAQGVFNSMAASLIYSTGCLDGLNTSNRDLIVSQLELQGIINASSVVTEDLAMASEVLAQNGYSLADASETAYWSILNEAGASEATKAALYALNAAEIAYSNNGFSTQEKIDQLGNLAKKYGDTATAAIAAAAADRVAAGHGDYESVLADMMAQVNRATQNIHIELPEVDARKAKGSASKAGKDVGKSYKDGLKEQLSDLDSVISGITSRIDDNIEAVRTQKEEAVAAIDAQIDALNEQKSALEDQKKALEEERDARIEIVEQQKKQLELAIKAIDKQIKQKEKVIKGIQDEINSLKNANEQRKLQLNLQREQYELERLQHQKTILQYSEDLGMHYVANTKDIRSQKEKVDDAKLEIEIANKQKQIDLIEKEIDLLNEKKDAINEQIDLLDEQIDQINEFYDQQVKAIDKQIEAIDKQIEALEKQKEETEKYYESLIENMEKSKSKYEELTELVGKAELSAKLKQLGIDEEALVNGSEEEFQKLKNAYLDVVFQLNSGNKDVLAALQELSGYNGTAPAMLEESNTKLGNMNDELGNANTEVGKINTSLGNTASTTGKVSDNIGDLSDKTTGLGDSLQEVNSALKNIPDSSSKIGDIAKSYGELATSLQSKEGSELDTQIGNINDSLSKIPEANSKIDPIVTSYKDLKDSLTGEDGASTNDKLEDINDVLDEIPNVSQSVTDIAEAYEKLSGSLTSEENVGLGKELSEINKELDVVPECNAALYSRQKKHFIFDSINTITAHSFR